MTRQKRWQAQNPEKLKGLQIKRFWPGSTWEEALEKYEQLHRRQKGACAICMEAKEVRQLSVDHSHKTGKVRGLLCGRCNRGLGMFEDNPDLLVIASDYLEKAFA